MMAKIRIEMKNNSDARALNLRVPGKLKHNGGKTIIAEVASDDVGKAVQRLEDDHNVKSYKVES